MDEHFTPDELTTIERLNHAPQPSLSADSFMRIQQRVLDNVSTAPHTSKMTRSQQLGSRYASPRVIAFGTGIAALVIVTLVVIGQTYRSFMAASGTTMPQNTLATSVAVNPSPATTMEIGTATLIPTDTVTGSSTSSSLVVIEGPIQAIDGNTLTVNNTAVAVAPDSPILNVLDVGDLVHIEGTQTDTGVLIASTVNNIVGENTQATIYLEGRVQTIDAETITINNIHVQLAADDPRRKDIKEGSFLSIDGYFQGSGANTILVILKATIIHDADVAAFIQCDSRRAMGMGSPPQPDAMGMGSPSDAMGMGSPPQPDGMGMGMGNPPATKLPNCNS